MLPKRRLDRHWGRSVTGLAGILWSIALLLLRYRWAQIGILPELCRGVAGLAPIVAAFSIIAWMEASRRVERQPGPAPDPKH